MRGRVYLVGAGPGDRGLITVRGQRKIEEADVILYDRLINELLLEAAPDDAQLIYVGKKPGGASFTQKKINQMMIEFAEAGKMVVRLKAGDPFVFGRGGEEALALTQAGIDYQVIPGISAAIGTAAYTGIPLTHRGVSSSVAWVTGHRVDGEDWERLGAVDTLVIFMGVGNLSEIVGRLLEVDFPPDTPLAAVEWATTPRQVIVRTTLAEMNREQRHAISPPAIIVLGETVRFHDQLDWFTSRPLFGKTILVTRPRSKRGRFCERLEEAGAHVRRIPAIRIVEIQDNARRAVDSLDDCDWLTFTSTKAVEIFVNELLREEGDLRHLAGIGLAAVGKKTAESLEKLRLRADLVPEEYTGEGLLEAFQRRGVQGQKIVLLRAEQGRDTLPRGLECSGASVDDLAVYRVKKIHRRQIREAFEERDLDLVVFSSALAVESVCEALGDGKDGVLADVDLACIGPVTGAALRNRGFCPTIIPDQYDFDHLFEAVRVHYGGEK